MHKHGWLLLSILFACGAAAQLPPIGQWREHVNWSPSLRVCGDPSTVWCATSRSLFYIDLEENSIHTIGKVNGLTTTGIRDIAWDNSTASLVVAFENGAINIVKQRTITSILTLRDATAVQRKTIYQIFVLDGWAYLSTDLGIIVVDLLKNEIKDTYTVGANGQKATVFSIAASNDTLYAFTSEGMKQAPRRGVNLSDFRNWVIMEAFRGWAGNPTSCVKYWKNQLLIKTADTLWSWNGNTRSVFFADGMQLDHISVSEKTLLAAGRKNNRGTIIELAEDRNLLSVIQDPYWTASPAQVYRSGSTLWIADQRNGLSKYVNNVFTGYRPEGPPRNISGQMLFSNGTLWAAPFNPADSWEPQLNKGQPVRFIEESWRNAADLPESSWDSLYDIHCLAVDEKEDIVWGGALNGGLFSLRGSMLLTLFNRGTPLSAGNKIGGVAVDSKGQLWVTNYGSSQQVQVRKKDGSWLAYRIPYPLNENAVGRLLIDPLSRKWIQLPKGQGIVCFDDNQTPEINSDDRWRLFRSGIGNGNLPDNEVHCMAIDKNGLLWIGTNNGVGIIQCMEDIFRNPACEAILPVVQQGNFAGYLLKNQIVKSMAIDGANRKWLGTANGAWLMSADADSTLLQLNMENSPLPDNAIMQLAIHPQTGEVFFATPGGMVSYRSTATEADAEKTQVLVFPNPVPPDYDGPVAIRGLRENALVKIITTDGRLVYETQALGGQAIWNGRDQKGHKPASGIFLVLSGNDLNSNRTVGKIIFIGK